VLYGLYTDLFYLYTFNENNLKTAMNFKLAPETYRQMKLGLGSTGAARFTLCVRQNPLRGSPQAAWLLQ